MDCEDNINNNDNQENIQYPNIEENIIRKKEMNIIDIYIYYQKNMAIIK